jgi:hypothetical protein
MKRRNLIAGACGVSLILGWLVGHQLQNSEANSITAEFITWGLLTDATVLQYRNARPDTAITMVRAYVRHVDECAASASSAYPCHGATFVQAHIMLAELCHDLKDALCEAASLRSAVDECVKARVGDCSEAALRQHVQRLRAPGVMPRGL